MLGHHQANVFFPSLGIKPTCTVRGKHYSISFKSHLYYLLTARDCRYRCIVEFVRCLLYHKWNGDLDTKSLCYPCVFERPRFPWCSRLVFMIRRKSVQNKALLASIVIFQQEIHFRKATNGVYTTLMHSISFTQLSKSLPIAFRIRINTPLYRISTIAAKGNYRGGVKF